MTPNTYIPILRNKSNERQVIQSFGGLSNYEDNDYRMSLHPLVEVTGVDDLENLGTFLDAGDQLLVELPVYQSSRSTDFGEAVQHTLSTHGDQAGFYLAHSEVIPVPVVSQAIERTPSYDSHSSHQEDLELEFDTVAHRLMVRAKPLNDDQKASLQDLSSALRPTDRLLFDVVDTGYNDDLRRNLEYLTQAFSDQDCAVLNLLSVFKGERENRSPKVAEELGLDGFGDFSINVRYPGGGGPTGTVKIRHYHPHRGFVEEFEGDGYVEASQNLTEWDEWSSTHCDYCRNASGVSGGGASAWKRIRTGHYITSMLRGEF